MNANTSGMTRKEFIKKATVGAAAVGAAALGLSGTARAAEVPRDPATYPVGYGWDNPSPGPYDPNTGEGCIEPDGYGGFIINPSGKPDELINPATNKLWINPLSSPGHTPTGIPSAPAVGTMTRDSRNVQWAVQNVVPGGKVKLLHIDGKPFLFPQSKIFGCNVRVGDKKGCIIEGEVDEDDPKTPPLTIIKYGCFVFSLSMNVEEQPVILRNLVFDEPIAHAAGVQPTSNPNPFINREVTIENCKIINMQCLPGYSETVGFWTWQFGGKFTVNNCSIDMPNEAPPWTPNDHPASSSLLYTAIVAPGGGQKTASVKITNNIISLNSSLYHYPYQSVQNDNVVAIVLNSLTGATVTGNIITGRPYGVTLKNVKNSVISGNTISFQQTKNDNPYAVNLGKEDKIYPLYGDNKAISILGDSRNNVMADNTVTGFSSQIPGVTIESQVSLLQSKASGTITSLAGSAIPEGTTLVIYDGNTSVTFEFDKNGSVLEGNVPIPISVGNNAIQVASAIATAINNVDELLVSAAPFYNSVYLLHDTPGAFGNSATYNQPTKQIRVPFAGGAAPSGNMLYGNTFGNSESAQVYLDSGANNSYFGPLPKDQNKPVNWPGLPGYDSALPLNPPENVPGNKFGSTKKYGVVCEGNGNEFFQNTFGQSLDEIIPCVWVAGTAAGNKLTNNDFTATGLKGFLYQVSTSEWIRAGDILFATETSGNTADVYSANFTPGDRCSEVADLTFTGTAGSNTIITRDFTCTPEKQEHLAHMLLQSNKYNENKARIAAMHTALSANTGITDTSMQEMGYVWDGQQWVCPAGYHVDENGYCVPD